MAALGVVPDGRPEQMATTAMPVFAAGWQPAREAVTALADGIQEVTTRLRKALPAVADADPVTEGILIETVDQLEKQHWMLRAQLH